MDIDFYGDICAQLREKGRIPWVQSPEWGAGSHVNNWRRYVGDADRKRWAEMSDEARGLAYLLADAEAMNEEWD